MTTVLTVGHSTRSIDEFVSLLRAHGVTEIADVRRYPGSRRYPWFSSEPLARRLSSEGIGYRHVETLGGRRDPRPASPHTGLRNEQFRGYADHMQMSEFTGALADLIARSDRRRIAILCAEADPGRCHRSMIADALDVRGVGVEHIVSADRREPHSRTEWARVEGDALIYAATQDELPLS